MKHVSKKKTRRRFKTGDLVIIDVLSRDLMVPSQPNESEQSFIYDDHMTHHQLKNGKQIATVLDDIESTDCIVYRSFYSDSVIVDSSRCIFVVTTDCDTHVIPYDCEKHDYDYWWRTIDHVDQDREHRCDDVKAYTEHRFSP